jgi:predicted Zn-dependent protease
MAAPPVMTQAQAQRIVDRALAAAKKLPGPGGAAAQTIVSLDHAYAGNTRYAVGEITSSADVQRITLSVTVQYGLRSASATTNQVEDRAVDDVVARAARMARLSPENPEAMPPLGPQTYAAARGASDAATAALSPTARAAATGGAIKAGDAAKVVIAGFYDHASRMRAIGTSGGANAYHAWTSARMSTTARTADATGSGWAEADSHRAADVDAAALAKVAVDKAVKSAKPTKLDPGRYTVVLEPAAVANLLSFLTGSFGARRADEGRSFFGRPGGGNRLGEELFPEIVTLRTDPTDAQLTSLPFDREGLPMNATTWLDKGVVKALAYNRYWAKKKGVPANGGSDGWILEGGKASREDLLKGITKGVLITRFWYLRMLDPQTILATGLTRDGTFLIENGAVTRPINNFRFNESPVHMLAKCDAMTVPVGAAGIRVPALRTHEFNLASISEAV